MIGYYLIVNIIAIVLYGVDKVKAKMDAWRTPEKTLLFIAAIGGAFGAFLGMNIFRHKTRKPVFKILVPVFAVIHIVIIALIYIKFGGYFG